MDRRERKYYLVSFDCCAYDMRMDYIKICCPTRKVYPAKDCWHEKYGYYQMLMSCRKEDAEALEYELKKALRRDGGVTKFIEI